MREFIWTCFGTIGLAVSVLAQDFPSTLSKRMEKEKDDKKAIVEEVAQNISLESAIDANAYRVGPGDRLIISVWGQVNESFPTVVTPEGMVVVPTVKSIDIKNLNLVEAKAKIIREMKTTYANADISIALLSLRSFRVNVTGMVNEPGSIVASGALRVSQCITMAGGFTDKTASKRNIQVRRSDGSTVRADLVLRNNTGDLRWDPFVNDGDVILVPPIFAKVYAFGAFQITEEFEFVDGERVSDLIVVAGGLQFGADSTSGELIRMKNDTGRVTTVLPVDLWAVLKKPGETATDLRLKADDRLFVRLKPQFHEKAEVEIRGEVMFPGKYSVVEGQTKVTEIIKAAGGFTQYVSLDRIVIYRDPKYEGQDPEFERLKATPVSDMNDVEKSYFKAKSRQANPTVQTDFKQLYHGDKINPEFDVLLRKGDIINVASLKKTVTVVGGATLSGIVDWIPGRPYGYYIEKSGGFTPKAKRGDVRIIKGSTQKWLDADNDVLIEDGDVIFIPEKEPLDGWQIFKDALTITGQMAAITSTIILIFFTVNRN